MNTLIHLQFKQSPPNTEKDHYFGSLAAIYDTFTSDQVGIKLESLWSNADLDKGPYENKICVIKKDVVKRKQGNRGKQK